MKLTEKNVVLRKLVADEGKVIVSKTLDEEGKPTVMAKEVYLANGTDGSDFEEIDEPVEEE